MVEQTKAIQGFKADLYFKDEEATGTFKKVAELKNVAVTVNGSPVDITTLDDPNFRDVPCSQLLNAFDSVNRSPKTILLLVTDSPQGLLPTIISRCQKIVLSPGKGGAMDEVWHSPLMEILHNLPPTGGLGAARLASQLKRLFDIVKEGIADAVVEDLDQNDEALDESKLKAILEARTNARLKEVQADVFRVMLDWHRDVLMLASGIDSKELLFPKNLSILSEQATRHTQGSALQAIQVVEGMARRLDRNIPDLQIFDEAFRKLVR